MDSTISKALVIAGSILLAMIVVAFVVHSFTQIGSWATTSDQEVLTKQLQEFNKEYEAYDKSLMYGVDVISCLNKVKSNNDKIIKKEVVNGETYDASYEIKVKMTLKSELEESIKVYHMRNNKEYGYENNTGPNGVKIEKVGFSFFSKDYKNMTKFKENDELKTTNNKVCNLKEFLLTKDSTDNDEIIQLLSVSSTISEIKKNDNKDDASQENSWTKVEFRSALYDLKTKKFKCQKIDYRENGRINYIEFKEI